MTKHILYRKNFYFILLSCVLWVLCCFAGHNILVLTHEVLKADPNSPGWTRWVYELYPRLQTERWRFDDFFFLSKAHQILIRTTLAINILLAFFFYKTIFSKQISNTYHRLINLSLSIKFIPYITLLLYACLLLVIYNAIIEFKALIFFEK